MRRRSKYCLELELRERGADCDCRNSAERFEKAFKGLDKNLWHVFTDPSELAGRVEELVRKEGSAGSRRQE